MSRFIFTFQIFSVLFLMACLVTCTAVDSPPRTVQSPSTEELSEFEPSLLLITGEEDGAGEFEVIALNIHQPIDGSKGTQLHIDEINSQDGIAVIPHPGGMENEDSLKTMHGYCGLELTIDNQLWDAILTDRVHRSMPLVWGFMSDDAHGPTYPNSDAFIMVRAPRLTKESIAASILQGSFYSSLGGALIDNIALSGNVIRVSLPSEMEISFVKESGQVVKTVNDTSAKYEVNGDEGYIRIEVRTRRWYGRSGEIAWSQPFRVIDRTNIENPYSTEGQWYKGNTHCHTNESDGQDSPLAVVWCYQTLGYDFLAITDHDKVTTLDY